MVNVDAVTIFTKEIGSMPGCDICNAKWVLNSYPLKL